MIWNGLTCAISYLYHVVKWFYIYKTVQLHGKKSVLIFPLYSARYVEVDRDIYWDREKNKQTIETRTTRLVVKEISGYANDTGGISN